MIRIQKRDCSRGCNSPPRFHNRRGERVVSPGAALGDGGCAAECPRRAGDRERRCRRRAAAIRVGPEKDSFEAVGSNPGAKPERCRSSDCQLRGSEQMNVGAIRRTRIAEVHLSGSNGGASRVDRGRQSHDRPRGHRSYGVST